MPKRTRSIRAHATANRGPQTIEWASAQQEEVFRYGPAPILAAGGFGSGKTAGLALKALWLSDTFPNNRGVVGRKVWEELKHTTLPTFFKWCRPEFYQPHGKRSDTEKYLRLNNGSEILWMHMENAETENVIRGLEINWFFLDQAEEIDEQLFDLLLSRLGRWDKAEVPQAVLDARPKDQPWQWTDVNGRAIVPTYAMLACNPDSELHWLYRRFHPDSREHQDKWSQQGYKMVNFDSRDNKFLTKQNKSALLQQDESFVRRFVEGVWGMPEGTIHKVDGSSLVPGTQDLITFLKRSCRLHRGMDHGDASPTACLWTAVNREGDIFVFREYYQPDKLISYHRGAISSLSVGEQYGVQVADPSIFHKTAQKYGGMWSVADEYSDVKSLSRQTVLNWTPGDNDEMGTRNRISELLRPLEEERVHPLASFDPVKYGQAKGKFPRLFFITRTAEYPQGCDNLLRELRAQRRVRIGTDNGRPIFSDERDESISDHAYDALRYLVASRVSAPALLKAKVKEGTWDAIWDRHIHLERTGGYRRLAKLAGMRS